MDVHRNAAVSGDSSEDLQPVRVPSPERALWEDLFWEQNKEGDDDNISLQWLSIFMEDCLSGSANFTSSTPLTPTEENAKNPMASPGKPAMPRTKRRKNNPNAEFLNSPSESPLLHQTHWLAESELITVPNMEKGEEIRSPLRRKLNGKDEQKQQQPRRCSHCLSQKTPQWRAGPMGPKTLCNACGVRFKSGRLLPEYRPAKSPTFVSYKHSNSHKKVMEMRMAVLSSNSN
ncbi:GATA transcription factor 2 [Apostasia shenzhenica]|uniref:GATA transcription factor 2 n=1 Tax=Apostasia shenzhenica TaxID=1088818 RepID=A0A2I0ARW2_9ASPA|nr:GATA transcription factor 2 [Apostasia shenzhenica]